MREWFDKYYSKLSKILNTLMWVLMCYLLVDLHNVRGLVRENNEKLFSRDTMFVKILKEHKLMLKDDTLVIQKLDSLIKKVYGKQ